MSKVSVLVAVYNAEKYLSTCLDSLINQTLKDIQIICIDDASTDSSDAILQSYARKDARINVLRMEKNSGQAKARNHGLEIAEGEFTTMLDSDDWMSEDALEKAYDQFLKSTDVDVVLFDLLLWENGRITSSYQRNERDRILSGKKAFELSLDWKLHGLYMVRTDLHRRFLYDTSCKLYSDDNTTRLHFLYARNVGFCNGVYYYRQHQESATHAIDLHRFDYLDANLNMKKMLIQEKVEKAYIDYYEQHRWVNLVGIYGFYKKYKCSFDVSERNMIKERFKYILSTIEPERLGRHLKCKFGYIPFKSFFLFCLEEDCYFFLRKMKELIKK